jgi:type II secretory pathway component PulC
LKIIDEVVVNENIIKFYSGIDFDYINSYDKKELIIIFIDNWSSEIRNYKIDSVLEENKSFLDEINNDYIMIYQTNGFLEPVYETIKKKILTEQSEWSTTTGIKTINSI